MQAIKPWLFGYPRSIWHDTTAALRRVVQDRAALATIILVVLPWWALIFIRPNPEWLWVFGEIAGLIFVYWWMSRSGPLPPSPVKYPRTESLFAIVLVVAWMLWRTGICTQSFPFLPPSFSCFKNIEYEIIPKLAEQVVLPIAVLWILGYRWRAQGIDWNWRAWWVSVPAIVALSAYGLYLHWNNLPNFGQRIVEFFFAAGLPEEVLFRALLFTRLEAWWRNSTWALFGASAIFGLVHLPINYLVFTSRDMREAWITLLTFQMGMGVVFCFAYQRTRNVWPLAAVHALIDAL
ncbi:MAG: CPBP family intramembrane metalloprotease [Chloroflexi bacterium]|nr:CPBP family intramembrane metalloprotease [Chloroflexota bacterium]